MNLLPGRWWQAIIRPILACGRGETGRRAGFRFPWGKTRAGSNPVARMLPHLGTDPLPLTTPPFTSEAEPPPPIVRKCLRVPDPAGTSRKGGRQGRIVPVARTESAGRAGLWRRGFFNPTDRPDVGVGGHHQIQVSSDAASAASRIPLVHNGSRLTPGSRPGGVDRKGCR